MTPTLHLSVHVTRRKRVHIVEDDAGAPLYTCRTCAEAFEWLRQESFELVHVPLKEGTLELRLGEFLPW